MRRRPARCAVRRWTTRGPLWGTAKRAGRVGRRGDADDRQLRPDRCRSCSPAQATTAAPCSGSRATASTRSTEVPCRLLDVQRAALRARASVASSNADRCRRVRSSHVVLNARPRTGGRSSRKAAGVLKYRRRRRKAEAPTQADRSEPAPSCKTFFARRAVSSAPLENARPTPLDVMATASPSSPHSKNPHSAAKRSRRCAKPAREHGARLRPLQQQTTTPEGATRRAHPRALATQTWLAAVGGPSQRQPGDLESMSVNVPAG